MTAPAVVYPSPNEWPTTTQSISGITNAAQAVVHCASHGFTSDDVSITSVGFTQVHGMIQINGLVGVIQTIVDTDHFSVNINSTSFFTYVSGGTLTTITGEPPVETIGSQTMNTPFKNTFDTN